jgi:hypothetical protein
MYELKRTIVTFEDARAELEDIASEAEQAFGADRDRQHIAEQMMFRLVGVLDAWPKQEATGFAATVTEG